jgi:hypothetical protein
MKKVKMDPEQVTCLIGAIAMGLGSAVAWEYVYAFLTAKEGEGVDLDTLLRYGPAQYLVFGKSVVDERRKLGLPDRGLTDYGR